MPAGSFSSVAVGENTACGVRDDRSVACWGYDDYGMATPPAGEFSAVAVGSSHSCGVRAAGGALVCWGADWMLGAPAGAYSAVSAGSQFSCALRAEDGVAVCWGADVGAPKKAPPVGLAALASGTRHSCGVRRGDEGVTCWGDHALVIPEDLATGNVDSDGDGHRDAADAFPADPAEWADGDGDGVGDNADKFPADPAESADTDGDGVGNNADRFPNDPAETSDSDGDGVGDHGDNCPNTANAGQADRDGNGRGDACDVPPPNPKPDPQPEPKPTAGQLAHELVAALGPMPHGIANALTGKLEKALERHEDGNDKAACRALTALTNQLRALTGKKVPDTAAVRTSLEHIRTFMGCGA